ncbi:HEAT repeat domain-containing protein [bacterium]|nr:HEAT repeat domain-containing protein [bacterium]
MFVRLSRGHFILLVLVFTSILTLTMDSGFSKTPQEIQQEISTVLMMRHSPAQADWWLRLGPGTSSVILSMYQSTTDAYRRVRLLEGLAWFSDDAEAVRFLKQQADGSDNTTVRNSAIKAVGQSQGVKEADFISKFLKSEDGQTRVAAARALMAMDDAGAQKLVDDYQKTEKQAWVLALVKGSLMKPAGKLVPVASNEQAYPSELEGKWKGYWIYPRVVGGKGLIMENVTVSFAKSELANLYKGNLQILPAQTGEKNRFVPFEVQQGKEGAVTASLNESSLRSDVSGSPTSLILGMKVQKVAGAVTLQMEVSKFGGVLVMRKE